MSAMAACLQLGACHANAASLGVAGRENGSQQQQPTCFMRVGRLHQRGAICQRWQPVSNQQRRAAAAWGPSSPSTAAAAAAAAGRSSSSSLPSVRCSAASSSSSSSSFSADEDPYSVLGCNPLSGFDAVKVAHRKKKKEAEKRGDEEAIERLDRAYDSILMRQLTMRKEGVTFGSIKVSSDIKYADRMNTVPWRPLRADVSKKDLQINAGVAAVMSLWALVAVSVEWKPLQLLLGFFVFRLFMKLEPFYKKTRYDEDAEDGEKKDKWNTKGGRLLRCLGLSFACVTFASLLHTLLTGLLSVLGFYVPREFYTYQEAFITIVSAVSLFYTASYYR